MRKYDIEFKKEAVKKYLGGHPLLRFSGKPACPKAFSINGSTSILQENGEPDKEKPEMRKRILELEMERNILKKAELIFGGGS